MNDDEWEYDLIETWLIEWCLFKMNEDISECEVRTNESNESNESNEFSSMTDTLSEQTNKENALNMANADEINVFFFILLFN